MLATLIDTKVLFSLLRLVEKIVLRTSKDDDSPVAVVARQCDDSLKGQRLSALHISNYQASLRSTHLMRRQAAPEDALRLLQHRPRTLCKILITWAIGILETYPRGTNV